tara:strand:- start:1451 stop:2335 length:885 start_codon:yes stop_codon:yes gene_type:complete
MGEIAALGAATAWASGFVLLRAVPDRYNILNLNALRMSGPALVYVIGLVLIGWLPRIRELELTNYVALAATCVTGIAVADLLMIRGMRLIGVGRAYALGGFAPLFTTLFAWLLLDEVINEFVILGAVLVIAGCLLVMRRNQKEKGEASLGSRDYWVAVGLVIFATMIWGIDFVLLSVGVGEAHPIVANSFRLPVAALFSTALAWGITGEVVPRGIVLKHAWLAVLAGIVGISVGSFLLLTSLQMIGAARGAAISAVSPVITMILAAIFFRERMNALAIVGVFVAVIGVIFVSVS